MVTTHNLGFPRIGAHRELKFALENYWSGKITADALAACGKELRQRHWALQAGMDLVPVGDFSFYDQVLDTSFLLGNMPPRVQNLEGNALDNYFRVARGRSANDVDANAIQAGEMTKWFDTNYHYIVPELDASTEFTLDASRLLEQLREASQLGLISKPVIIGPLTYLWLGKTRDGSDKLALLARLLPTYLELLNTLAAYDVEWLQIDEPVLVTDLDSAWQTALVDAYQALKDSPVKLLLTTYFGQLGSNRSLAMRLPVHGLHIDALASRSELELILDQLPSDRILSLGVVNGRNIWKTDLHSTLEWLEPVHRRLENRLWIAPSCSLLHVPVDLNLEQELDPEIRSWLAFARQKLDEIQVLARALNHGRAVVQEVLVANHAALLARRHSKRVHREEVKAAVAAIHPTMGQRYSTFEVRSAKQSARLKLPLYPTTTIGSFPQTAEIRHARSQFRSGAMSETAYFAAIRQEIARCVQEQEALGLDVLVHGEAERNDMVEYFGEQLDGYTFSKFGWVQSYGSRCVKPPILFGDIARPHSMTVEWIRYAQSLTDKPMKGMLTGPVTLLNWSFVRDDQPRSVSCMQLALAIRAEVQDLERAGITIIQIDEAALREGLPLRRAQWREYLDWSTEAFRIAANGVRDETQIHTHMCYSEFNDIIAAIARLDADVITIETSRSDLELLKAFDHFNYPNQIGPGVYDIHSPNIPTQKQIMQSMRKAAERIPAHRLWINPDCGLKTRSWEEVIPALKNMVAAARGLRGGESC